MPRPLIEELTAAARGKLDDAIRWTERMIEAQAAGDTEEIRRAAIRAKQSAPRAPTIRAMLGQAAFALGSYHEAAQELLAYRRFSGDHRHDPMIADCYRLEGRPERALALLDELTPAEVRAPAWTRAQVARARALAAMDKADAARTILRAEAKRARGDERRMEAIREAAREIGGATLSRPEPEG